jgi:1-acyl-sn-glycerol-3-phosphate acyltransferase
MWQIYLATSLGALWLLTGVFIMQRALFISRLPLFCLLLQAENRMKPGWKPFVRVTDSKSPVPTIPQIIFRSLVVGPLRFWVSVGLVAFAGVSASVLPLRGTAAVARWVSRSILSTLSIRIRQQGYRAPSFEAPLLVSNHISAMDILCLLACGGCFVAKDGVKHIFGVGRAATAIGCIYVGRDSAESRSAAKDAIAETLKRKMLDKNERNNPLVIFPEGTTTNGLGLIEFRRGAFEAAAPFQPVRLEYSNLQYSMALLDAWDHLCYLCTLPGCDLKVNYLPVEQPRASDTAEELARRCREAIMNGTKLSSYGFESHRDEQELVFELVGKSSDTLQAKKSR